MALVETMDDGRSTWDPSHGIAGNAAKARTVLKK